MFYDECVYSEEMHKVFCLKQEREKFILFWSYDSKRTKDRDPTKLIENSKRALQKIIAVVNACKENKEECYWRVERKTKIVTLVEELKCH